MDPLHATVDVHQHYWPDGLVAALRARTRAPRVLGDTLELAGGARWRIDPAWRTLDGRGPAGLILVSVGAGLGLDRLAGEEARELAEVWLGGVRELGAGFGAWAPAAARDPDPDWLAGVLTEEGAVVGVELSADLLATRAGVAHLAPLLGVLGGRPVLIHPAPTRPAAGMPGWWAATVPAVDQLNAAWWAWAEHARPRFPQVPVCFTALAGLAPLHGERQRAHGGHAGLVDPLTFLDCSGYGPRALDAVIRVLGIDVICHGSGHPHTPAIDPQLDPAARAAIQSRNPARLLTHHPQEVLA